MAKEKNDNSGAAAALRRLEIEEKDCAKEIEALKTEKEKARENFDDAEGRQAYNQAQADLLAAYDRWNAVLKMLRDYDKSVAPEKRESGTKVTQEEARAAFVEYRRMVEIGAESFMISISQDLLRCKKSQEINALITPTIRTMIDNMLETGVRERKLPAWAISEAEVK